MGAAMGIDKQDIMSRMEGFALQGVKGLFILLCFFFYSVCILFYYHYH